jgi:hypothetical protein
MITVIDAHATGNYMLTTILSKKFLLQKEIIIMMLTQVDFQTDPNFFNLLPMLHQICFSVAGLHHPTDHN